LSFHFFSSSHESTDCLRQLSDALAQGGQGSLRLVSYTDDRVTLPRDTRAEC
jgi:hypothetical protein